MDLRLPGLLGGVVHEELGGGGHSGLPLWDCRPPAWKRAKYSLVPGTWCQGRLKMRRGLGKAIRKTNSHTGGGGVYPVQSIWQTAVTGRRLPFVLAFTKCALHKTHANQTMRFHDDGTQGRTVQLPPGTNQYSPEQFSAEFEADEAIPIVTRDMQAARGDPKSRNPRSGELKEMGSSHRLSRATLPRAIPGLTDCYVSFRRGPCTKHYDRPSPTLNRDGLSASVQTSKPVTWLGHPKIEG